MHDPTTDKPLEGSVLIVPCGYSISASTIKAARGTLCPLCENHAVVKYIPNFSLRGLEPLMGLIKEHADSALALIAEMFSDESKPQIRLTLPLSRIQARFNALMCAVASGFQGMVQALLSAKPDLSLRNREGQTALHLAAKYGPCENTLLLLKAKADPHARDGRGDTPLITASRMGNTQAYSPQEQSKSGHTLSMQLLINFKADVNACNLLGDSALTLAAFYQDLSAVHILIQAGANPLLPHPRIEPLTSSPGPLLPVHTMIKF